MINRLPTEFAPGNRLSDAEPPEAPSSTAQLIRTAEQLITNYPRAALGTAVLFGVILGCLIKRR